MGVTLTRAEIQVVMRALEQAFLWQQSLKDAYAHMPSQRQECEDNAKAFTNLHARLNLRAGLWRESEKA